ncbi:hypothetical protein EJ02DRAFT_265060 [Clathrospora elynae]|uniref:Secreted protein n=1 Tax=Clathrospora elynae TaxID=706981 RepID=A0A6A5SES9_9PLEO|nr:hypothetical protein EJ02DRAFT_265060 [Clathrospora elynae]
MTVHLSPMLLMHLAQIICISGMSTLVRRQPWKPWKEGTRVTGNDPRISRCLGKQDRARLGVIQLKQRLYLSAMHRPHSPAYHPEPCGDAVMMPPRW